MHLLYCGVRASGGQAILWTVNDLVKGRRGLAPPQLHLREQGLLPECRETRSEAQLRAHGRQLELPIIAFDGDARFFREELCGLAVFVLLRCGEGGGLLWVAEPLHNSRIDHLVEFGLTTHRGLVQSCGFVDVLARWVRLQRQQRAQHLAGGVVLNAQLTHRNVQRRLARTAAHLRQSRIASLGVVVASANHAEHGLLVGNLPRDGNTTLVDAVLECRIHDPIHGRPATRVLVGVGLLRLRQLLLHLLQITRHVVAARGEGVMRRWRLELVPSAELREISGQALAELEFAGGSEGHERGPLSGHHGQDRVRVCAHIQRRDAVPAVLRHRSALQVLVNRNGVALRAFQVLSLLPEHCADLDMPALEGKIQRGRAQKAGFDVAPQSHQPAHTA
mmetsp:Transcript_51640/g.150052  ORF Transcript_51640/g.150052 Transcript_51640/m.150052 type:complete len:391 (+) Transcript_51640:549-1721(+)